MSDALVPERRAPLRHLEPGEVRAAVPRDLLGGEHHTVLGDASADAMFSPPE
jgi:hypothetical protein